MFVSSIQDLNLVDQIDVYFIKKKLMCKTYVLIILL